MASAASSSLCERASLGEIGGWELRVCSCVCVCVPRARTHACVIASEEVRVAEPEAIVRLSVIEKGIRRLQDAYARRSRARVFERIFLD